MTLVRFRCVPYARDAAARPAGIERGSPAFADCPVCPTLS